MTHRLSRVAGVALALLVTTLVSASAPASLRAAPAPQFPSGFDGYHTYGEMLADIDALVAARPGIISKRSIGRSYEGRTIWAVKISDQVGRDEDEPEVLFESLSHAREHITVEQALRIINLLVDNYVARPTSATTDLQRRVSAIVRSREIWVVPMVNPDGGEYDISGDRFQRWRKNRQPILDSTAIGSDLNRTWAYRWGCCNGSSGNPADETYRGPRPWSAPEINALRNFVLSRGINGRQQIRAAISWHSFNEEIMWPYGYTTANVPRTMTADDLKAFRALGFGMANRNGYVAQQLSDLYILDGGSSDWLYGDQRIFAFTIEMYPTDGSRVGGFYPPDDVIERETLRNDQAVLYFLENADCVYRAAGLVTRCGPLNDDFETARGWVVDSAGTDTATDGRFERSVPARTATGAGVKQLRYGFSGERALVTGRPAGASATANDVDGGKTSVRSARVILGGAGSAGWRLEFRYSFAHDDRASSADYLRVLVNGVEVFRVNGTSAERNAGWTLAEAGLDAFAGQSVRVVVEVADGAGDSLVEAAVDDLRIYRQRGAAVHEGAVFQPDTSM